MNKNFIKFCVFLAALIIFSSAHVSAQTPSESEIKPLVGGMDIEKRKKKAIDDRNNDNKAKSVFGFNRNSKLSDITKVFKCREYTSKEKGNSIFSNGIGDWVTHQCVDGSLELLIQARKNGDVSALRGFFRATNDELAEKLSETIKLIGEPHEAREPRVAEQDGILEPQHFYKWGEWKKPDRNHNPYGSSQYFEIRAYETRDPNIKKIRLTSVDNIYYRANMTFNPEPIWEGLWDAGRWFFLFIFWLLTYKTFYSTAREDDLVGDRAQVYRKRVVQFFQIVGGCGFISLVVGAGGEVCSQQDMIGCAEYSGEYHDPWSLSEHLKFFTKILSVCLIGWYMAIRGHNPSNKI